MIKKESVTIRRYEALPPRNLLTIEGIFVDNIIYKDTPITSEQWHDYIVLQIMNQPFYGA